METFLVFLSIIGITHIVVHGKILEPIRSKITIQFFRDLFNCYQCTGFWIGAFISFLMHPSNPVQWLLFAGAGSFLAVVGVALIDKLKR